MDELTIVGSTAWLGAYESLPGSDGVRALVGLATLAVVLHGLWPGPFLHYHDAAHRAAPLAVHATVKGVVKRQ